MSEQLPHQPIFYDLAATDTIVRVLVRLVAAVMAGGLIVARQLNQRAFP
jgi:hypothetical protein